MSLGKRQQSLYQDFIGACFQNFWEKEKGMNCYNVNICRPIIPQSLFRDKHKCKQNSVINQSLQWKESVIGSCLDQRSEIKSNIFQQLQSNEHNENFDFQYCKNESQEQQNHDNFKKEKVPENFPPQIIENTPNTEAQTKIESLSYTRQKTPQKSQLKVNSEHSNQKVEKNTHDKRKKISQSQIGELKEQNSDLDQQTLPNRAKFYQIMEKSAPSRKGMDDQSMNNSYLSDKTMKQMKNEEAKSLIVSTSVYRVNSGQNSAILSTSIFQDNNGTINKKSGIQKDSINQHKMSEIQECNSQHKLENDRNEISSTSQSKKLSYEQQIKGQEFKEQIDEKQIQKQNKQDKVLNIQTKDQSIQKQVTIDKTQQLKVIQNIQKQLQQAIQLQNQQIKQSKKQQKNPISTIPSQKKLEVQNNKNEAVYTYVDTQIRKLREDQKQFKKQLKQMMQTFESKTQEKFNTLLRVLMKQQQMMETQNKKNQ